MWGVVSQGSTGLSGETEFKSRKNSEHSTLTIMWLYHLTFICGKYSEGRITIKQYVHLKKQLGA